MGVGKPKRQVSNGEGSVNFIPTVPCSRTLMTKLAGRFEAQCH